MIIFHTDIDYETLKQHRDELVEEARLLQTLQAPNSHRLPLRQQWVKAFYLGLSQVGRQLTTWGDRLQERYSPENQLPIVE